MALEALERQRYLGFSPQVRQSFAPVPRGYGEYLAAHLLVIGSAPLTVHSPGLAEGVTFGSRTPLRRAGASLSTARA